MTTAPMPRDPGPDRSDGAGYGQQRYDARGYDDPGHGRRQPDRPPSSRPIIEAGRLWAGGVATAVVAVLVALVGVLISRWLFSVPVLAPQRDGAYGDVHTTGLMLGAAVAALAATGIAHLLLLGAPRPLLFFGCIIFLATVLAVVFPFSTTAPLNAKIATAVVNLVLGIAIGTLISAAAARSVRARAPGGYSAREYSYDERNTPSQFR